MLGRFYVRKTTLANLQHIQLGGYVLLTRYKATKTHLLADASIAGKHIGVLHDGQLRGRVLGDLQHTPPLGEVSAVLLVLGAALRQPVQTWREVSTSRHRLADVCVTQECVWWS